MELKTLHNLLNVDRQAIKKMNIEQLRLILGVARYFVRSVEREINRREWDYAEKDLTYL